LPVFDRKKITKGELLISSLYKREDGRDFEMAKQLQYFKYVYLRILGLIN